MATLSLSIIEIIVLMMGAITLGVVIHFFISTRNNFKSPSLLEKEKHSKTVDEWKLRYFNDTEAKDRELTMLKKQLEEVTENNEINSIEAEETRKLNKKLIAEMEQLKKHPPATLVENQKPDYMGQLRHAQESLLEHNEKINVLLGQINLVKETEEKQQEILKANEQLSSQVEDLQEILSEKEKEIHETKHKQQLTNEMTSMIDSAYNEFNVLQEKIQKLESQVNASKKISLEYEDLKENHVRITKDYDELKRKYHSASSTNKQLQEDLAETEDKLKEANFQRQQLQKRISYLEELNNDMQVVAEANKKLEGQLKRVAELESMLNVISGERDDLAKKQFKL
jgi:chromosome segregation ATPase